MKRSKDGNSEALDCEFAIVDGQHASRKFWTLLTLVGTTQGHAKAGEISRARIRAILESARGIKPDDKSPTAEKGRQIESYADLDGLNFIGKIGVEPAQNGYKAKNFLDEVITPDRKSWSKPPEPTVKPAAPGTAQGALSLPAAAAFAKPEWAK